MSFTKISNPHPSMHRTEEIQTSGLNSRASVQLENGANSKDSLAVGTMRRRLYNIDFGAGSPISASAASLGRIYGVEPGELIQTAVARSLSPKTRRPDVPALLFLHHVMRSAGSGVARARARSRDRGISVPVDLVREQIAAPKALGNAYEMINTEAERARFGGLLSELAGDDVLLERLIDGIGFGLCGDKLAAFLKIGQHELATARRRLKRRAQTIALREGFISS